MWFERIRVLYYMLPGMDRFDYLKYIHGLRIRYEIWGLFWGVMTTGRLKKITKEYENRSAK